MAKNVKHEILEVKRKMLWICSPSPISSDKACTEVRCEVFEEIKESVERKINRVLYPLIQDMLFDSLSDV